MDTVITTSRFRGVHMTYDTVISQNNERLFVACLSHSFTLLTCVLVQHSELNWIEWWISDTIKDIMLTLQRRGVLMRNSVKLFVHILHYTYSRITWKSLRNVSSVLLHESDSPSIFSRRVTHHCVIEYLIMLITSLVPNKHVFKHPLQNHKRIYLLFISVIIYCIYYVCVFL